MRVPNQDANLFTGRLAELILGDQSEPEITIYDDSELRIDVDGRVRVQATGAEAILIVRGDDKGRAAAIKKLLASITHTG